MASRVNPTPSLPQVGDPTSTLNALNQALFRELGEHAYRLNLALMKDGTERMEGPLPLWDPVTADIPTAVGWEGAILYDTTTQLLNYSNGATWIEILTPGGAESRFGVNVIDYGADPTGVADSTTAFADAYAAVVSRGGGNLLVPTGYYLVSSLPNITINSVNVLGEGNFQGGSVIRHTTITGNLWTVSGQHVRFRNLLFWPTVRKTSGYQLVFASGCFFSGCEDVRIDYAYDGIYSSDTSELRIERTSTRYMLGLFGIYCTGTVGTGSYRPFIGDFVGNNPYPNDYGTVKAWAQNTVYTANDIVQVNGRIYQCSTGGTSAAVGTGPSGLGAGTTAESAFTATITDGTVLWKFVCQQGYAHITQDNYCYSMVLTKVVCINGDVGFRQIDSAATGTSEPIWAFVDDLETDHSYSNGVQLTRGEGFYGTNCWIGSALTGSGVLYGASYTGETSWVTSRFTANWKHGVEIPSGPVDNLFEGNFFGSNSQSGSNTYDGINVAANATHVTLVGNRSGPAVGIGANPQRYGIAVETGTGDYITVAHNDLQGNTTGGLLFGATGTNNTVWANGGSTAFNRLPHTAITYFGGGLNVGDDGLFQILNQADSSKVARFSAASITAGQTRTFTFPDASGTLMLTSAIGTTVQAWDADLDAVAALAGTGFAVRTAANTWAQRTITGTALEITVTNGDGVSGNPVLSFPTTVSLGGKTLNVGDADQFQILNQADSSKVARFSSAGITAGQTRTFTFPDMSGTLLVTDYHVTTTPLDTDHAFYFATYECLGATHIQLTQSEDQSDFDGGGFRDALTVFHYDDDEVDYEALADQKVSYAIRAYVSPTAAARLLTDPQYKDFTAVAAEAIGYIMWSDRGVSGITASAIQYGEGIASNEFAASNPVDAPSQSLSMASVQAIVSSKMAASDSTHKARGVLISNVGKSITAALEAMSVGTGGDNGQFEYWLKADAATVNVAAIYMPLSASANEGTTILYDTGDFTYFDRGANTFVWAMGGLGELGLSIGALYPIFDDGLALGGSGAAFADLWLASGAVINFAASDVLITHSSNALAFTGGSSGYSFDAIVTGTNATFTGGMRVGFAGTPTADRIELGDGSLYLDFQAGTSPLLNFDANDYFGYDRTSNIFSWVIGGSGELALSTGALYAITSGGLQLGDSTHEWADLFLESGAVINWAASDVLLTHSSNTLAFTGGTSYTFDAALTGTNLTLTGGLRVGFAGAATADLIELGDASFYLNFNSGNPLINFDANDYMSYDRGTNTFNWVIGGAGELSLNASALFPATSDGLTLGTTSTMWADLFLASGAVINWNNGDGTLTHGLNVLTWDGVAQVFNEAGADLDFRIEGDTEANLFFLDASTERVGIGTASPQFRLHVVVASGSGYIASTDAVGVQSIIGPNGSDKVVMGSSSAHPATIFVSNTERARFTTTSAVFNEDAADYDFRVEGDTNANLIFADASADFVGFGESAPAARVHSTQAGTLQFRGVSTATSGTTSGAFLAVYQNDGTVMVNTERLGGVFIGGAVDGSGTLNSSLAIVGFAVETWTGSTAAADMSFELAATGGLTRTERMRMYSAGGVAIMNGLRVGFSGTPTDDRLAVGDGNMYLDFNAGVTPHLQFDGNDYIGYSRGSDFYQFVLGGAEKVRIDGTATAGNTALMVYDVDNATLERVTVGAASSGGAGFKVLRIPN